MSKKVKIKIPVYVVKNAEGDTYRWAHGEIIRAFSQKELEIFIDENVRLYNSSADLHIELLDTLVVEGEIEEENVSYPQPSNSKRRGYKIMKEEEEISFMVADYEMLPDELAEMEQSIKLDPRVGPEGKLIWEEWQE